MKLASTGCALIGLAVALSTAQALAATTVTIATINNPDMLVMKELTPVFEKENPDIKVEFQVLPDNVLRQSITQDVAVNGGRYDIVTLQPYEVQSGWAKNSWLSPLDFSKLSKADQDAYDLDDIIKNIRAGLTYDGKLYALPFYGESSFTMYRKDLFEKAGLTMPERPTWSQIRELACKLHDPSHGVYGILMKGIPQYGQLSPLITLVHSFGASFFDMNWHPQFTSPLFKKAFTFYVNLLHDCGEPGASSQGVLELLTIMAQGKGAIWVDATVIGGLLQDPATSKVVDKIGYAFAPTEGSSNGGWLTAWSLGVVASSKHQDEAFKFIRWATSKEYAKLVADKYGVVRMPPGTRYSTYKDPAYLAAAPFAKLTLQVIQNADMLHPAKDPVPYTGTAQIDIPEFATWAADFAQDYSAVIAGQMSIDAALEDTQAKTEEVMKAAGYIKD